MLKPEPNRLAGGQPAPEEFADLAAAGVRHVVNLRPHSETPDINPEALVTGAGMQYHNLPIAGPADLSRESVDALDTLLQQIGDEAALVHCASSNRVGALMALRAAWLHGTEAQEALAIGEHWGLTKMRPIVEALLSR